MSTTATPGRYWIVHEGARVEVAVERVGDDQIARLWVDGVLVKECPAKWPVCDVRGPDYGAMIISAWPGRAYKVQLVVPQRGADDGSADEASISNPPPSSAAVFDQDGDAESGAAAVVHPQAKPDPAPGPGAPAKVSDKDEKSKPKLKRTPMHPPPGTRAARFDEYTQAHPTLYASRHVAIAVGRIAATVLGIGALFGWLLPLLFGWIPTPHIKAPDLPDLPKFPNLFGWLPDIDITLPAWLEAILSTAHWWIPVLIAIFVARNEARKRAARLEAERKHLEEDRSPSRSEPEDGRS